MSDAGREPTPGAVRLGIDFGTVCGRCGVRLRDEAVATVVLARALHDRLRPYREVREHSWPLCERCAGVLWDALFAAALDALATKGDAL